MKYVIILVISFGVHFLNFPINDRLADDESKAKNKVLELTRFNPDASLVSPTIDGRIDKNHNVVYCSSFEIAWIAVRDRIFGGKIKLDTKIPWVKALNKRPVNKSISATYISAISGFGKDDIITKINQDLSSRFGINSSIDFPIADYDIFSFAYLKKDIAFSISLNHDSNAPGLLFNDSLEVNFMSKTGAANPKFKSTFRIHDYKNEDDFIFQIETKSEEDEVFFAKNTGR